MGQFQLDLLCRSAELHDEMECICSAGKKGNVVVVFDGVHVFAIFCVKLSGAVTEDALHTRFDVHSSKLLMLHFHTKFIMVQSISKLRWVSMCGNYYKKNE